MGWKDSESLWVQEMRRIVARQRRSRWLTGAGMVVCGAVGVALLTGYWQAVASSFGPLGGVLAMIGGGSLPLTFMFLMFFVAALLTRLDGLVTSIPEHDGRVCARCRRPLTDDVRCERCKLQYVLQELREYWELFALAPKSASQQMPRLIAAASARFHGKPLTRTGQDVDQSNGTGWIYDHRAAGRVRDHEIHVLQRQPVGAGDQYVDQLCSCSVGCMWRLPDQARAGHPPHWR